MKKVITTVGTSLFENFRILNPKIIDIQINTIKDKSASDYDDYTSEIEVITESLKDFIKTEDASAEIKSLKAIQSECNDKIDVHFLSSDSILSNLAMNLFNDNLKTVIPQINLISCKKIKKLKVDNLENFEEGLINLIEAMRGIIFNGNMNSNKFLNYEKIQKISDRFIINISGGYKAIVPYLTIFAQLYNIQCKYIFEESNDLITIPNLPMGFDELFVESIYMDLDSRNPIKVLDISRLHNYGIVKKTRTNISLTAIGYMIKDYAESFTPTTKNVFGFIVEFKLFEYFINNPVKINNIKFKKVIHSDESTNLEFDLIMHDNEDKNYCFCEIKSLMTFIKKDNNITEKFQKRIKSASDYYNKKNVFFKYFIYSTNSKLQTNYELERNEILKNIQNNNSQYEIKFYEVIVEPDSKDFGHENPYIKYARNKIKCENIKEIKLN